MIQNVLMTLHAVCLHFSELKTFLIVIYLGAFFSVEWVDEINYILYITLDGPFVGPFHSSAHLSAHANIRDVVKYCRYCLISESYFFCIWYIHNFSNVYMYGLKSCSLLFWYKQFLNFRCCYLENDTMEIIANFIRNCFFFHFHQSKMKYSLRIIPLDKI